MLPPVETAVLLCNPNFNALYSDLCKNKLNSDGTTKLDTKAQRDRDSLSTDLRKARIEATKRDLVVAGLQDLSYRLDELPIDLQQVVAVVAALLDGQIADEDSYLLHDDLAKFKDNVEQINAALSKKFEQNALTLSSMLDADSPVDMQELPATIRTLKDTVHDTEAQLNEHRLQLAQEAVKIHELYRQIMEGSINILEQVIHGSVARGAKAKADYLSLVAEGMDKKLRIQHAQLVPELYSPDTIKALDAKVNDLQVETRSAKRKMREAEEKLDAYRHAGGMEGLAKEYADVLKESKKVKADIERLKDVE